ncbi:glycosyltransferase family 2 protein [Paenibacillus agilis]|uniref:Glycosyltransferase family 2 protein n=1 Tax=Paenibacillus agilis TaxID=3020863 RepID=A0A559IZS8_9BACL|nr:glycosyltransferase family 2 protein [Paenibacillus agilis]TVX93122.1 glycosyltransferase family 2 protein [Paenibacillus agilis]
MSTIIHTLPLLIRSSPYDQLDRSMLKQCLQSLSFSEQPVVVIYNQGSMSNDELAQLCQSIGLPFHLLGSENNIGIAQARQKCFEFIWENYPHTDFISEIHVDMIFPPNWYQPLIDYLKESEEPLISPGILTAEGALQPLGTHTEVPTSYDQVCSLLSSCSQTGVMNAFVHPVIHRASILRVIGGYDTRFLRGKQGYEDDSLLLGYLYYMGLRSNWRPKCCLASWVYHATLAQRMSLPNKHLHFAQNEQGLIEQYGANGLQHLQRIYPDSTIFQQLLDTWFTARDNTPSTR